MTPKSVNSRLKRLEMKLLKLKISSSGAFKMLGEMIRISSNWKKWKLLCQSCRSRQRWEMNSLLNLWLSWKVRLMPAKKRMRSNSKGWKMNWLQRYLDFKINTRSKKINSRNWRMKWWRPTLSSRRHPKNNKKRCRLLPKSGVPSFQAIRRNFSISSLSSRMRWKLHKKIRRKSLRCWCQKSKLNRKK